MAFGDERDLLGRIEALLETITRAHLVIYSEHRKLVDLGLSNEQAQTLLDESADIVLQRAPDAARAARAVAQDQALRRLLDPKTPWIAPHLISRSPAPNRP